MIPSVAVRRRAVRRRTSPDFAAFVAGADYAQNPPAQQGAADVIADFNAQLEGLKNGDPAADPRPRSRVELQAVVEADQ